MSVVSIENSEHYNWDCNCDGWHLVKSDNLSVIQERVPFGCSEARHYHERAEQFFYILSGMASFEMDGVTHELMAGQGIHVIAGISHMLSNQQQEDLVFIVLSTPPGHSDRVYV